MLFGRFFSLSFNVCIAVSKGLCAWGGRFEPDTQKSLEIGKLLKKEWKTKKKVKKRGAFSFCLNGRYISNKNNSFFSLSLSLGFLFFFIIIILSKEEQQSGRDKREVKTKKEVGTYRLGGPSQRNPIQRVSILDEMADFDIPKSWSTAWRGRNTCKCRVRCAETTKRWRDVALAPECGRIALRSAGRESVEPRYGRKCRGACRAFCHWTRPKDPPPFWHRHCRSSRCPARRFGRRHRCSRSQVCARRPFSVICCSLPCVCLCVCGTTNKKYRQAGREEEQGAYGFLGCRVHCCCTHTHTGPTNSIRETHDDYTTRTAGKWWLARHSTLVLHHHFRFDVCFPSFFLLFLATTSWPNEEEEASNPFW